MSLFEVFNLEECMFMVILPSDNYVTLKYQLRDYGVYEHGSFDCYVLSVQSCRFVVISITILD